jgi:hypothetical protein
MELHYVDNINYKTSKLYLNQENKLQSREFCNESNYLLMYNFSVYLFYRQSVKQL